MGFVGREGYVKYKLKKLIGAGEPLSLMWPLCSCDARKGRAVRRRSREAVSRDELICGTKEVGN